MYVRLSPALTVRNEKSCSFLQKVVTPDEENMEDFIVLPLPPYMGHILANIGKLPFDEAVEKISKDLHVSSDAVKNFINQLTQNKTHRKFKAAESAYLTLPPNMLVKSDSADSRTFTETSDFSPTDDFIQKRPSMPFSVNLMVTSKCTTDCIYCYAKRTIGPDLPTDKLFSIIDELKEGGVVNLSLTGGDIFARKDWLSLITRVKQLGYHPFLSTKTIISEQEITALKNAGYDEFQFSLDSIKPETLHAMIKVDHKYITRVEKMFHECSKHGMKVGIRTVLTKLNSSIKDIESVYNFICQFDCVHKWAITPAFFSEYKQKNYKKYEVGNDELKDVYKFAHQPNLKFPISLNKISDNGYKLPKHSNVEEYVCHNQICIANTSSMSILSNGVCGLCEMLYDNEEFMLGDLRINSLRDVWNSERALSLYHPQQEPEKSDSPCEVCKVFDSCKRGPGKRVCYLDIAKTGGGRHDPDPRCPMANKVDVML